jgi:hypothetical protein
MMALVQTGTGVNARRTRWRRYPRGAEAVEWKGERGGSRALYVVPGGLYLESVPLKDRQLILEVRDRLTAYLESGSLRLPGEDAPVRGAS